MNFLTILPMAVVMVAGTSWWRRSSSPPATGPVGRRWAS